jgi:hypothetical protein
MAGANVVNFPEEYIGLVMGFLLLFYGLSGVIYSQIYAAFYKGDIGGFLLFLVISIAIINTLGAIYVEKIPISFKMELVDVSSGIRASEPLDSLASPLHLLPSSQLSSSIPSPKSMDSANEGTSLLTDKFSMTPKEMLISPLFWLYALATILQQGLTYMANVNAIIQASMGPGTSAIILTSQTALHVTILSASQSAGSIIFGIGTDWVAKYKWDRSVLLVVAEILLLAPLLGLGLLSDFSIATSTPFLVICSGLIGLGWGAGGALFPTLTRSLFGTKYYGTASAFVMVGVPIGIFSSNTIFGSLYDQELARQNSRGGASDFCYGSSCFRVAFIATSAIQGLTLLASVGLFFASTHILKHRSKTL